MSVWDRIRNPEDALHERKPEGAGERDFKETITAFANSVPEGQQGILFVGLANDGTVLGCRGAPSLQKTIARIAQNDCYPPIEVQFEISRVEGKDVLAVVVPHSKARPHFSGHAFYRKGEENAKADENAYRDFYVRRAAVNSTLLDYRGKECVKVRTLGKKLGNPSPLPAGYSQHLECTIEEVDYHTVTLRDAANTQLYYEPIENFSISRESHSGAFMFVVHLSAR
jgi:hypothetical protein